MPASSEKQRRMMAAARSYKRGTMKGKPSKKIKELAESMSDKDLTDFMKKKAAGLRGHGLRRMLDRIGPDLVGNVDSKVLKSLGLGSVPSGDDLIKAITKRVRLPDGTATTTAHAAFAPVGKLQSHLDSGQVYGDAAIKARKGLSSLASTLRKHLKVKGPAN